MQQRLPCQLPNKSSQLSQLHLNPFLNLVGQVIAVFPRDLDQLDVVSEFDLLYKPLSLFGNGGEEIRRLSQEIN